MAQEKIPLDATRFATGMAWKDYLAQMGDTKARTEENYNKASLTADEKQFFSGLNQVKHVLMLGENWCGDVHRNSPMIARIVEAMPGAEMRVFLRDQNVDLTDCFLNNGYRSIPIVVFFDKDWNEIGRWIERAGTATRSRSPFGPSRSTRPPRTRRTQPWPSFASRSRRPTTARPTRACGARRRKRCARCLSSAWASSARSRRRLLKSAHLLR